MTLTAVLSQLQWREPAWLLLALLPLLTLGLRAWRRHRVLNYAEPALRPWAMRGGLSRAGALRTLALALAWVLLAAAAAGPRLPLIASVEGRDSTPPRADVAVMVVLDVSPSMAARDVAPDRLQRALLELQDLRERLQGERLGLVAYSGRAGLLLPPSTDHAAFAYYLPRAAAALAEPAGTSLAEALQVAYKALQEAPQRGAGAVLLVTDGEDWALNGTPGTRVLEQAQRLRAAGIPVYVLGVGTAQGAPVPDGAGGVLQERGEPVISRSDPRRLQELAAITGGRYVPVSDGDSDWRSLYEQGIARLPSDHRPAQAYRHWRELYAWALAPALLLLVVATVPLHRAAAALLPPALVLAGLLGAPGEARAQAPEQAAFAAYQAGDYALAQTRYARLQGYGARQGEGASAYRRGDYGHAASQFGAALLAARDDQERADALFNLGNSRFREEAYAQAVEAYQGALVYRPADARARHNLALARSRLVQRPGQEGEAPPGRRAAEEYGRMKDVEPDEDFPPDERPRSAASAERERGEIDERVARGELWTAPEGAGRGRPGADVGELEALYRAGLKKLELVEDQDLELLQGLVGREARGEPDWSGMRPW